MPEPRDPQLDELRRRARRRLIGAIVLALAAAVLVPMLLESDPRPLGEDVAVRIPPVDEGKFVSKVGEKAKEPAAVAPAPKPEPAPPAAPAPAASPPASEPAAPGASSAAGALASAEQRVLSPSRPPPKEQAGGESGEAPKGAPSPKPEPPSRAGAEPAKAPAKAAEAPRAGSFSVQLAAFIDDKGANALAGRLKRAGYPAYTEPYTTSRGTVWRVRVGPYPSREDAEAARGRLKGDGQNGIITAAK